MPSPDLGHDLLFGILAMQSSFLSKDELLFVLKAQLEGDSRTLAEILVAQNKLSADERDLITALVKEHLSKHGGDATQSLAVLSSVGSLKCELQKMGNPSLDATAEYLHSAPSTSAKAARTIRETSSGSSSRFRILRPHAKGGLGEVYVAQDLELQREVALKEIQEKYADRADSRSRFVLEAEVTGALEHPGIVPVYGLGQYADGRPFYAMRFIRGDSLKEAVDQFYRQAADKSAVQPQANPGGQHTVEFRKLLGRFLDVCNAIEYAHSRGVLHRDLKPGNVMLGKYGETLVVDWGLAKITGREDESNFVGERNIFPASSSGSAETEMGSAIGTPAYMSPEQAAGRVKELGPASDVYSLGATLYYVLTGVPPFTRDDLGTTLKKVQAGDFPHPRSVRPEVSPALAAVCLKAMAVDPANRYATPAGLAEDVEKWLADEPVSCWQEPLAVRTRRWLQRHRTLATSTVAALAVVLLATIGGLFLQGRHNRDLNAANSRLSDANAELRQANTRESVAKERALANELLAKKNEALAKENATKAQLEEAKAKQSAEEATLVLEFVSANVLGAPRPENQRAGLGIDATIRQTLDLAVPRIANTFKNQPTVEASVRESLGKTFLSLGEFKKAVQQFESCVELREKHLGAEHQLTLVARSNLAVAIRHDGQTERAISMLVEVLPQLKKVAGPTHEDTLACQHILALAYQDSGRLNDALALVEEEVRLKRELLAPDEPRMLSGLRSLALLTLKVGQTDRAIDLLENLVEVQKKKFGIKHLDVLNTMNNLGSAYKQTGKVEQAISLFELILKTKKEVVGADHPDILPHMNNLATAYRDIDDFERATPLFEETLRLAKTKLGPEHPNTLFLMHNLGAVYVAQNRPEDALPYYEQAVAGARRKLGIGHYNTLNYLTSLANTHEQLGQSEKAEPLWQELTTYWRQQAQSKSAEALHESSFFIITSSLRRNVQRSYIEQLLREVLKVSERQRPDHWTTADIRASLGANLMLQKRYSDAEPLLLAGYQRLGDSSETIPSQFQRNVAETLEWLVQLYEGWEKPEQATQWKEALEKRRAGEAAKATSD